MARTVTMWCPLCELWTKKYDRVELHDCQTEVISTGDGEQPEYESTLQRPSLEPVVRITTRFELVQRQTFERR